MIAVCTTPDEIRDALALHCEQQNITRLELDRLTGLAGGYSGKILGHKGSRKLAIKSLLYILDVLDLELVIRQRCAVSTQNDASDDASDRKSRTTHFKDWRRSKGSSWSRRMNGRRNLKLTPPRRSEIASRAAQMRWRKPRLLEVKGQQAQQIRQAIEKG